MKPDPDYPDHEFRRSVVLEACGITRGQLDTWEISGLWRYCGPDTRHRLFSFLDLFEFALVSKMLGAGISTSAAWSFLNQIAEHIRKWGARGVRPHGYLILRIGPSHQGFRFVEQLDSLPRVLRATSLEWDVCVILPLHRIVADLQKRLAGKTE